MQELRFRAMGTDAHVIVHGGPPTLALEARRRIDQLEARWSRFIDTSEVSALNRRPGEVVEVSADTALLVQRAVDAWRMSGASVDATVLGDLLRAGYDRPFDELTDRAIGGSSVLTRGCDGIEVDGYRVRLPVGTGFDPGGIGKGLAADLVVEELMASGASGACVNLGGDVRVDGHPEGDSGWTIAWNDPWDGRPVVRIGLRSGAIATSSTLRRRWLVGGVRRHHLIDPATGEPSTSDLVAVTVVAGEGWMAEVLAKAVLLRGSAHPFDLIGGSDAESVVVDRKGRVQHTAGLEAFLGEQQLPPTVHLGSEPTTEEVAC